MFHPDPNKPIFQLIPGAIELINEYKCIACKNVVDPNYHITFNSTIEQKFEYSQTGICPKCQTQDNSMPPPPPPPQDHKKYSHVCLVVDRSGSVVSMNSSGFSDGFQQIINDQKQIVKDDPNHTVFITLCTFDTIATTYLDCVDVEHVPNYTKSELGKIFDPRNTTRLVDTIYENLKHVNGKYQQTIKDHGKENVNCTVMVWTDGDGNADRLYSPTDLNLLITDLKKDENFNIVFIAANQDAVKTGARFGIDKANCLTCDAVPQCAGAIYRSASNAITRGASGFSTAFTQEEHDNSISHKRSRSKSNNPTPRSRPRR
jgi:uncharacterized protein YegL